MVDGRCVVVGSANMDIRSKELNEENVLGILDPALAAPDGGGLPPRPRAVGGDRRSRSGSRRGFFKRVAERGFRLFAEQY